MLKKQRKQDHKLSGARNEDWRPCKGSQSAGELRNVSHLPQLVSAQ
jgi:hypothetical protein